MPVVKQQQATRGKSSAIVLELADLEHEGVRIVAEAQREAERIVTQARREATAEAERLRQAARETGQKEGYAAGLEAGRVAGHDEAVGQTQAKLTELTLRWSTAVDDLQAKMPTHLADTKTDLVRLALGIASRVTRLAALRDCRVVEGTVAAALERVSAGRSVTLLVNPDELAAVERYLPALLAKLRTVSQVEVKPEAAITAGGCVARFGAGQIDATLETQMQRVAEELLAGAT